jgi:uncharacterized membrane protein
VDEPAKQESMNLVPDWAPNVHPLVVHFPIALLLTAAGLDAAGLALRCNRPLRFVATVLYVLGTATLVAAYFTGRAAAATVWLPGMAHAVVAEHWEWAFRAIWFFGVMTLARLLLLWRLRAEPRPAVVALLTVAGLIGGVLLGETGDRGATLVYRHGVGITRE